MNEQDLKLPALIDRARSRLTEARSSAEVLEAMVAAQAALHYAKLIRAANETQADCLKMIARAKIRMANEIDGAQQRGELAQRKDGGRPSKTPPKPGEVSKPATFAHLNIDPRRVHEWRVLRDAGEAVLEMAIHGALDEGRAPRMADIWRELRKVAAAQPPTPADARERARREANMVLAFDRKHHLQLTEDEERAHDAWLAVRFKILAEVEEPDIAEAVASVPAHQRAWVTRQVARRLKWLERFQAAWAARSE
jgi:hypothetical protein